MNRSIISVKGLSKKYNLGATVSHDALRDHIAYFCRRLIPDKVESPSENKDFWALRDISFDVQVGDVVGIIGRNGAGKSTLLKILSQITEPSRGEVHIRGRVASLLEVGTGFHPELSGRENIYLNGAILGMSRQEIKAKFEEIVAFAEVEKFLDTPVKRYSSGMYVRLAFAVAAHLEPEILIVDEVLAVGDVQFQKKCLGKMQDVAGHGRTVLFVSHNMSAITRLCKSCIVLDNGQIKSNSDTKSAVAAYLRSIDKNEEEHSFSETNLIASIQVISEGKAVSSIDCNQPFTIFTSFKEVVDFYSTVFSVSLYNQEGIKVASWTTYDNFRHGKADKLKCNILHIPLFPGLYYFNAAIHQNEKVIDHLIQAVRIEIISTIENKYTTADNMGVVLAPANWMCE